MTGAVAEQACPAVEPVRASENSRIMPPLPESLIEQLAELWCEALLANIRRHPLPTTPRVSK